MRIITTGATRIVVLVGPYAIKFARIRFVYCLKRTFSVLLNRQTTEKCAEWQAREGSVTKTVLKALLIGVIANRAEYRRWRKHPDPHLVPTLFSILWLINVQIRGEPLTTDEYLHEQLVRIKASGEFPDMEPHQCCTIGGVPMLADYGYEA